MKKLAVWTLVLALGLMAAHAPALAEASTTTIHISRTLSDVRPNPCNGEPVRLEAELRLVIHRTTNDDGSFHVHRTSNLHGTGVGLVTGAQYRISAVATSSANVVGATTQTLWQDAVLVGQGNVPNLLFQQTEHFTIDADGDVTVNFDMQFVKCQG